MQCHSDVLDMITTGCTRQQTKAGMVKTAMLSKSLGVVTGKQHCVKLMRIYVNYRLKKKKHKYPRASAPGMQTHLRLHHTVLR